jgi:hypothetical protein
VSQTLLGRTSWSTADDNAANTFVDAFETSGVYEALSRLQARFDSVYGKEEQVYCCSSGPSCLDENVRLLECFQKRHKDIQPKTARMSGSETWSFVGRAADANELWKEACADYLPKHSHFVTILQLRQLPGC